jgi:membrane glycosyltransferase
MTTAPPISPTMERVAPFHLPNPILRRNTWRVFLFFSLAVLLTGVGGMLFADLLWRTGWSPARILLLFLFCILFFLSSVGCMHGVYGFFLRRRGDRRRLARTQPR